MSYAVLDLPTGELQYISAGHPPIVHVRGANANFLPNSNLPIGWLDDAEYEADTVMLQPGDRLFLYSDGVPKLSRVKIKMQYGDYRLLNMLRQSSVPITDSLELSVRFRIKWCHPGVRWTMFDLGLSSAPESLTIQMATPIEEWVLRPQPGSTPGSSQRVVVAVTPAMKEGARFFHLRSDRYASIASSVTAAYTKSAWAEAAGQRALLLTDSHRAIGQKGETRTSRVLLREEDRRSLPLRRRPR